MHFDVAERSLPLEKFSRADALFATSSLRLIAPCSQLDAITYPSEANEIVMELQTSIKEVIAGRLRDASKPGVPSAALQGARRGR